VRTIVEDDRRPVWGSGSSVRFSAALRESIKELLQSTSPDGKVDEIPDRKALAVRPEVLEGRTANCERIS
jgi:ribosomal protein S12 methylthiotransferase accessory factor YcaO